MDLVLNFIAVFAALAIVLAIFKIVSDVIMSKKSKKLDSKDDEFLSEYDGIVRRTYVVEHERQRNKGIRHREIVYLNRAKYIREKTQFFNFVNNSNEF